MEVSKDVVLGEIRKHEDDARVQQALNEPPDKIDHEHAQLLQKFGIDPGQLAEKAARRGLARL